VLVAFDCWKHFGLEQILLHRGDSSPVAIPLLVPAVRALMKKSWSNLLIFSVANNIIYERHPKRSLEGSRNN